MNETAFMSRRMSVDEFLNRAIEVAASLTQQHVVVPGSPGWGSLPEVGGQKVQLHPSYQVHAHSVDEFCLALGGTAAMVLDDKTYRLHAPAALVLRSKVSHGEGAVVGQPYDILWIGMAKQGACFAALSSYRPRHGWLLQHRMRLREWSGQYLLSNLSDDQDSGPLSPAHWPRIQNEVLRALVDLQTGLLDEQNPSAQSPGLDHGSIVADVQRYLLNHLSEPLRLDDVAHLVRLSPNYINTVFREHTGETIHAWLIDQRMKKSMSLCRETKLPFKDIAAQVGFQNALYFSKAFRRQFDMTPTDARANAAVQSKMS